MTENNFMETIVFFSRCELVNLYGRISKLLPQEYKILHIAYSDKEEEVLKDKYSVKAVINFQKEIRKILNGERYEPDLCNNIDKLIIEQSEDRFNLNGAIQYDRTFQNMSYQQCLILTQAYYKFWYQLINCHKVTYLIHEMVSLFFNQIAALICKGLSASYITHIQVYGENENNFLIVSGHDGSSEELMLNMELDKLSIDQKCRVDDFLIQFRSDSKTFFNKYSQNNTFLTTIISSFKIGLISLRNKVFLSFKGLKYPADHLKIYLLKELSLFQELKKKWGLFFLRYDKYDKELNYYYYPLHLEPEAVVLYWGDGIYKNQVKLIENIAAQLPPNCYLFVKDHPHANAYRDIEDYMKIKRIPNVKLLDPNISGKYIINNSIGVITINGTSGFEAILLNKQIYTFGNTFYNSCKRVKYIKNVRDLKHELYSNINKSYSDDDDLYNFVYGFLESTHKGFTDYFLNYAKLLNIDEEKNSETVVSEFIKYFERCRADKNNPNS